MAQSHSAFTGEIPLNYDKYLGPLIFKEYAEDLAQRITIPPNGLLLETAAGSGMATRQLRNALPKEVRVTATDLNEDMLAVAKDKFDDNENIEFRTANAIDLPFEDATFDAIACQFSVMFFPDKLRALEESARVLKNGGKLYFNIWDSLTHNHFAQTVNKTVSDYLPDNPPDFFNVPYGYHDINVVKNLLLEAGFSEIEISVLPRVSSAPQARDVALGFTTGTPLRLQLEQAKPDSILEIVDAVEQAVRNEFGDKTVAAKMQAIVFTAHYPS